MKPKERLWTRSFFLIWQGQLVSTLGDSVYTLALGFWVLNVTGSTAIMGILMAVSALPGIWISPFAGVWIDRLKKKPLLVAMDMIRGVCMLLIAAAAYFQILKIWMVFAAGILLSVCGAVFRPGINSSIPGLVPKSRLSNANSLLSLVSSGANMIGSAVGGFLYQVLGTWLLFFLNGVSYFFSGSSLVFTRLPENSKENQQSFFAEMRDGFHYIRIKKGLPIFLLFIALYNFFSLTAIVLFLPLFEQNAALGASRYGIAAACFMGGCMAGFLLLSVLRYPPRHQPFLFIAAICLSNLFFIFAIIICRFAAILPLIFLGGFFNAVVNVIYLTIVQSSAPDDKRGKVLAFMSMTTQGLSPLAMALGGVIAAYIPIRLVIVISFSIPLALSAALAATPSFRNLLSGDRQLD